MLRVERQSARMSKITNDARLNPVWDRSLYGCTHGNSGASRGYILFKLVKLLYLFIYLCFIDVW